MLHRHLEAIAKGCLQRLSQCPSLTDWTDLCQVSLTQVVMFNRRRGGEAQRMLISSYLRSHSNNLNVDITHSLSKTEKALCKEFRIVDIEGKRGKRVPVLLTKNLQNQIDKLLSLRTSVGVTRTNPYVFGRQSTSTPYRSSDCLRKYAHECGAENPTAITSTRLRKHIATMSQVLALRSNELDLLASFMGHNILVHREFYRLPEQTLHVAKLSKLLMAMERGDTVELSGKTLDDIDVNLDGKLNCIVCLKINKIANNFLLALHSMDNSNIFIL